MDGPGTVFCLVPLNKYATLIVNLPANRGRACIHADDPSVKVLRIGLDQRLKSPPQLARFGRHERNDVILTSHFSRNDQCYFNFNKDTGELLLHDLSENDDTELYPLGLNKEGKVTHGDSQLWKKPRQCAVVLDPDPYRNPDDPRSHERECIFQIGSRPRAVFRLVPRRHQSNVAAFTDEKRAFAGQPDPERTVEGTLERLVTLGLESLRSGAMTSTYQSVSTTTYNPHNTRFRTLLEPEEDHVIRFTKLRPLGRGGQGDVHKVVDLYNGNHHACKVIAVKGEVPQLNIHSEKDFRAKVEMEVNLVRGLKHAHVVPYLHCQGFKSRNVEIFMPIYDGSLHDLIRQYRPQGPQMAMNMTERMLSQILDALSYVHASNPPIIHRDIKPANILYQAGQGNQGDRFLLTDFGIAKVVDTSRTVIGTWQYVAPEVILGNAEQTPKVDIYSLGVTVVECLAEPKDVAGRPLQEVYWQQWQKDLQRHLSKHAPRLASMLANDPYQRPTARGLLETFFAQPDRAPPPSAPTNVTLATLEASSSAGQANDAAVMYSAEPTAMEWTRTVATATIHRASQSTQPISAVAELAAAPYRPAQPRSGRGTSVKSSKSAEGRPRLGRQRVGSSQTGSPGVPKRTASSGTQRPRTRSMYKALESQGLEL
ncbi:kinase-like protein [Trichocladium antarcticum]|uniref:Kinase-like protein n=1 Tax=Trichocladium antarcticum TaxID=1450529 RepID=A0AAN6UBM0_9PEZI|nr:kinase-like protein [Trichocladium antarcticum]